MIYGSISIQKRATWIFKGIISWEKYSFDKESDKEIKHTLLTFLFFDIGSIKIFIQNTIRRIF